MTHTVLKQVFESHGKIAVHAETPLPVLTASIGICKAVECDGGSPVLSGVCQCLMPGAQVQKARAENVPIRIQLPDGSAKEGVRGVTTPQDILQQLPRSVAKKAVVAKVDGRVWDMFVPLEGDCNLQILTFEDPEGKEVPGAPGIFPVFRFVLSQMLCFGLLLKRPYLHLSVILPSLTMLIT